MMSDALLKSVVFSWDMEFLGKNDLDLQNLGKTNSLITFTALRMR